MSPADSRQAPEDGLPRRQLGWAMTTLLLGIFMAQLDASIANVALPTLSHDLGVSPAATVWVVNAFQLASAIFILPFSSLSERIGYRRVYLLGLLGFTLSSLACAVAPNFPALVAARAVQGLSGAAIGGVSQALVRVIYPRSRLGSGMSWYTLMVAVSSSLGPTVGSGILSVASWPWLFAVNIPVGIVALYVGRQALPKSPRLVSRLDPVGTLLNAGFFGLLILGVDGLGDPQAQTLSLVEMAAGFACGVTLWFHQAHKPTPLLPVDLFRIPIFALSSVTSICAYAAQTMALLAVPFFVQIVLGRDQSAVGLVVTPWPLAVMVVARIAGWASDHYREGLLAGIGLIAMASGLSALALLPDDPSFVTMVWRVALCGVGFGFFQTPNNRVMMTAGPKERSGAANGAMGASRTLGQTSGAAIAAAILAALHTAAPHAIFVTGALFAGFGAVISLTRLATPPRQH